MDDSLKINASGAANISTKTEIKIRHSEDLIFEKNTNIGLVDSQCSFRSDFFIYEIKEYKLQHPRQQSTRFSY